MEKIGTVKNPLTIIAIFAAIAEVSGTIVLPFLEAENQSVYVWFLMIFPIALVLGFFLTLNFNHKVLYAPSDFQNEEHFFDLVQRSTSAEKNLKIREDLALSNLEEKPPGLAPAELKTNSQEQPETEVLERPFNRTVLRNYPRLAYMIAEELAFERLSREFDVPIERDLKVRTRSGSYVIDGVVDNGGKTTVIEVKYIGEKVNPSLLMDSLRKLSASIDGLPQKLKKSVRVVLVLVTEGSLIPPQRVVEVLDRMRENFPYIIEVKTYTLDQLQTTLEDAA